MVRRIENVWLLKVIGVCELITAGFMLYFSPLVIGIIAAVILTLLAINSFYQAHKCYQRQYSPQKED